MPIIPLYTKYLLFLCSLAVILSACRAAPAPTPTAQAGLPSPDQDKACRQTIRNLYTIEFYCPDDLQALQSLYTQSFISAFHPTLDRCTLIEKYELTKLLSQSDPGFIPPLEAPAPGDALYYAEIRITDRRNAGSPGESSPLWIQVRTEAGQCKVDGISGGG